MHFYVQNKPQTSENHNAQTDIQIAGIACMEFTVHGLKKFRLSNKYRMKIPTKTPIKKPLIPRSSLYLKSNTCKIANISTVILLFQKSQFMPEKPVTDIKIYPLENCVVNFNCFQHLGSNNICSYMHKVMFLASFSNQILPSSFIACLCSSSNESFIKTHTAGQI